MDEIKYKSYQKWISTNVPDYESAYGNCKEVCEKMQSIFTELAIAKGWYEDPIIGDRQHWWLKTVDGVIIDPTKIQFPSKGFFSYRELTADDPLPKGRCMNCGVVSYYSSCACSKECEEELEFYWNGDGCKEELSDFYGYEEYERDKYGYE